MYKRISLALTSVTFAGLLCHTTLAGPELDDEAAAYLDRCLTEMERLSIRRTEIDWSDVRTQVFEAADGAQSPAETHDAIRLAIRLLDDGHSYLYVPAPPPTAGDDTAEADWGEAWVIASTSEDLTARRLDGDVGYVLIPSFGGESSWDPAAANAFADRIHEAVRELDASGVTGWVVDLRFNSGGNMWPMLAGLGPLVGDGEIGAFVAGRSTAPWLYAWGGAGTPGVRNAQVATPHRLENPGAPVAVLTGKYCLSSGEAIVTALRGRPNTRFFGVPTGGASTATQPIWLGDGAMVFLTTAVYADRTGRTYGGPIAPDVVVEGGPRLAADLADDSADPVLAEARRWLSEQAATAVR